MTADKRSPQNQGADPVSIDLTDTPMTPAMEAVKELSRISDALAEAQKIITEHLHDAEQISFAEGLRTLDICRVKGKDPSHRNQIYRDLRLRGIEPTAQGWRERLKNATPQERPDYLNPENFTKIHRQARALARAAKKLVAERDRQYPAVHERTRDAIMGDAA